MIDKRPTPKPIRKIQKPGNQEKILQVSKEGGWGGGWGERSHTKDQE